MHTSGLICIVAGNGEVQKVDCTGTLPSPRTLHSSAWYGDVLYVWGGGKQGSEPVSDVQLHVFDAATKSWKQPTLKGTRIRTQWIKLFWVSADIFNSAPIFLHYSSHS